MSIPSRQIGWSTDSNLLWQILKQLTRLTSVMFAATPKYKVYTALLNQVNQDAPVATVLQNTLGGEVVWTTPFDGTFDAILNGVFTLNKVVIFVTTSNATIIEAYPIDINTIELYQVDLSGMQINGLNNVSLEIRVYN